MKMRELVIKLISYHLRLGLILILYSHGLEKDDYNQREIINTFVLITFELDIFFYYTRILNIIMILMTQFKDINL